MVKGISSVFTCQRYLWRRTHVEISMNWCYSEQNHAPDSGLSDRRTHSRQFLLPNQIYSLTSNHIPNRKTYRQSERFASER